jgi:chemotaxis protein MotA
MKASTPIGIVVCIGGILAGAMMEGTPMGALLNIPAALIIFGGIAGVSIATSGMDVMKLMPTLYKKAMSPDFPDQPGTVRELVGYAEKARKEGLLALEPEIAAIDDAFTKKGLQLVVDGTDPDLVREVLDVEIESMEGRHRAGQKLFKDAGGYAPTIGVLGTVMGLLHVMQLLDQPQMLGPAIAGAFMATLYGVGSANVIFMPVAGRLATLTQAEVLTRTLVIEGILAIQAGENPRVVSERLLGFLPPDEREAASGTDPAHPNLRAVPDAEAQAA